MLACVGAGPQDLRVVLLDLDGVLYVENEPLHGAREAVAELREPWARSSAVNEAQPTPGCILSRWQ